MGISRNCSGVCLGMLALAAMTLPAAAASNCTFAWAQPGTYVISGNFRGSVESTTARLTPTCKIVLNIPGVFTGGPLRRAGQCLKFSFKVEGKKQAFNALWCKGYGIVPWQGRNIRASVSPKVDRQEQDWKKSQNFKSQFNDSADF